MSALYRVAIAIGLFWLVAMAPTLSLSTETWMVILTIVLVGTSIGRFFLFLAIKMALFPLVVLGWVLLYTR